MLQWSGFLSTHFVDCLVHRLHDVKTVEHMNRTLSLLCEHVEIRLPHITA